MIQEHKWRFLGAVLARTQKHGVGLTDMFKAIASMEKRIRECYSETIEYSSHDFIEMMVLDGCFVIELFCIVGRLVQTDLDDPIFNMSWLLYFLMRDFLRLENQIPFFVLQTLFELSILASRRENIPSLTELTLGFFDYVVQRPTEVLDRFLSDHGIIENYFGTDTEVAKFFNNIGKDIAFDIQRSYLAKLFEDVNEYYRNNWHVRWAGFKYTYFNTHGHSCQP
ncbi:hypothetical protein GH714_015510 [Hevea brasiliensis]|uniref:Uncharacterized protein n=1 Tax=Hevea brasiliensis TaxID=3981 RepID=A0A6A6LH78_HEVBR|nr:hypothetical protein GH714_015510 [Hevea brasiliensis]